MARCQARLPCAAAVDDVGGLPVDSGARLPGPATTSPVVLWDSILLRRLATQFPETKLDASQVTAPFASPSSSPVLTINVSPPKCASLLWQWYNMLQGPPLTPTPSPVGEPCDEDDHEVVTRCKRIYNF
jgi:hypothetical protein